MSLRINQTVRLPRRERGVALVIALILLMVLTMIAVVAMRTTTLDLKMSNNMTLHKRTFQVSESARARVHEVIVNMHYHSGWPATYTGGTVPASANFTIPAEILIDDDPTVKRTWEDSIEEPWNLNASARDMELSIVQGNAATDMTADLFVSWLARRAKAGSNTGGTVGNKVNFNTYYRIIAVARGASGTESITDAVYRVIGEQ